MEHLVFFPTIMSFVACRAGRAADQWATIRHGTAAGCACLLALTLAACGSDGCSTACSQDTPAAPPFAYIATPTTLTTYSANGGLGGPRGSPLTFPDANFPAGIVDIATDPSGHFLYLLDQTSGIYAFNIDANTGALTAIPGSPFATPWLSGFLAIDVSGTHLYVAGLSSPMGPADTLINVFSIAGSGALVPSSAYYKLPQAEFPMFIAGNYLYVGDSDTNSVTTFSIGPSGELSQSAAGFPFGTDTGPYSIAAEPSGSLLYRATYGPPSTSTPGAISAFMIDPSTGALTPAPGNPQLAGIQGQISISIDPTGRFLFALQSNGVSVYGIDAATGALSEVTGSPFAAGDEPMTLSVDPTNHIVYVVNLASSDVSEFTLGATGTLTPLAGSPVPIGSSPCCMVVVQ